MSVSKPNRIAPKISFPVIMPDGRFVASVAPWREGIFNRELAV
jgi:hypothetical protein